jgi:hypothetical protein
MPLAESLTTASKVAPPAREKATAAPGSDALNDGLRDNLTDTLVPAHMASAAFRKETNQTVGRRGEGLQRVESLIDGVGMASRMVDEAGPAERTAALGELLATTLEAIKQMKAWRVKHPKKRRWKQMQPYLTELSAIALTLDINDVEPGAPVVGQAVVEPDSTKMRTAKGTIDASSDTGKESADDYEDDSVKSIAREGLDVLGAASDNTAAGADIGHEGYIELNSQGGNAMQVVDGYALGARGGADIGLGLRQMVDGDDARTKVEGGVVDWVRPYRVGPVLWPRCLGRTPKLAAPQAKSTAAPAWSGLRPRACSDLMTLPRAAPNSPKTTAACRGTRSRTRLEAWRRMPWTSERPAQTLL